MKNPMVGMTHFGKVYKRKIDVFYRKVGETQWVYVHSTNAYPTCIDAANSAAFGKVGFQYKAWFAK